MLRAADWDAWITTDWPEFLDPQGKILDGVLASAQVLAMSHLVRALSAWPSARTAFQRLPELFDPRIKDHDSARAIEARRIRSKLATLHLKWLRELLGYVRGSTRELSSGADALWSEIQQVSIAAADRLPSLLAAGKFPLARTVAPPSNLSLPLARLIGEDLLRRLGAPGTVNRFWSEYGEQEGRERVPETDGNEEGIPPAGLGSGDQEDLLLDRHPYLMDWRAESPVEAIAQKYSLDADRPITPAQMFARILRVINAYAREEQRQPLDEPNARQWLEEYTASAIRKLKWAPRSRADCKIGCRRPLAQANA